MRCPYSGPQSRGEAASAGSQISGMWSVQRQAHLREGCGIDKRRCAVRRVCVVVSSKSALMNKEFNGLAALPMLMESHTWLRPDSWSYRRLGARDLEAMALLQSRVGI